MNFLDQNDLNLKEELRPVPEGIVRFCCPRCEEELNVTTEFAGVSGPCPACFGVIRAPRPESLEKFAQESESEPPPASPSPIQRSRPAVSTSDYVLPTFDSSWDVTARPTRGPSGGGGGQIGSVKKIESKLAVDDGWKEKVERQRKKTMTQKKWQNLGETLTNSAASRKFQRIGLCLIAGILVVTMAILYLDRRSGNTMLRGIFNQ